MTVTAQIAYCWLFLYGCTGERCYLNAGRLANSVVRHTVRTTGTPELRGGSYPIYGDYKQYSYVNWATKFCVDSNLLESSLRR